MIIRKIPSEGLSHYSYFISAAGMAAVVDPRRDCETYLELARDLDVRITSIFETHRNEDYVIGSLELASRTGAAIYHGSQISFAYGNAVKEGDTVCTLEAMKMEMPISATTAGTVAGIHVAVGANVAFDDPLVSLS